MTDANPYAAPGADLDHDAADSGTWPGITRRWYWVGKLLVLVVIGIPLLGILAATALPALQ